MQQMYVIRRDRTGRGRHTLRDESLVPKLPLSRKLMLPGYSDQEITSRALSSDALLRGVPQFA